MGEGRFTSGGREFADGCVDVGHGKREKVRRLNETHDSRVYR